MNILEYEPAKYYVTRANHNSDIVESVKKIVDEKEIRQGIFFVIGALQEAKIGYYNQETLTYEETKITTDCEIASCTGNISRKDNEISIHTHAVLTGEDLEAQGGHLISGKVFAAEIHVQEMKGKNLDREHDKETDLDLWDLE